MKATLKTGLVAAVLLAGSSLAIAEEGVVGGPTLLTTVQLDAVDGAGYKRRKHHGHRYGFAYADAAAEGAAVAVGRRSAATSYNGSVAEAVAGQFSAAASYSSSTAMAAY